MDTTDFSVSNQRMTEISAWRRHEDSSSVGRTTLAGWVGGPSFRHNGDARETAGSYSLHGRFVYKTFQ